MVFKVMVRGREVNTFQSLDQALEEFRSLRAVGEDDVRVVAEVRGES